MMQFTGRREPISMSGAGKAVGVILRRRPCFFARRTRADRRARSSLSGCRATGRSGNAFFRESVRGPARTSAVTMRLSSGSLPFLGCLLEFPEHPDKGRAQADHNRQEQQRLAGAVSMSNTHGAMRARTGKRRQQSASAGRYTKSGELVPADQTLFGRTGRPSGPGAASGSATRKRAGQLLAAPADALHLAIDRLVFGIDLDVAAPRRAGRGRPAGRRPRRPRRHADDPVVADDPEEFAVPALLVPGGGGRQASTNCRRRSDRCRNC